MMNPIDFLPPDTLLKRGTYKITQCLAQDERQMTYRALNPAKGQFVILKEFFPRIHCQRSKGFDCAVAPNHLEDFTRYKNLFMTKAEGFRNVRHPNTLSVLDLFEENNTAYCVLENIDGPNLTRLVKTTDLKIKACLQAILTVGSALEYLHDRNIIHGQVNPDAIFVQQDGLVKLSSFEDQTLLDYTAHEGLDPAAQITPSFDIYALGATLYFLLTGQSPPIQDQTNTARFIAPKKLNPTISDDLNALVLGAMAFDPKNRYQSMQEFFTAVNQVDLSVTELTPPPVETPVEQREIEIPPTLTPENIAKEIPSRKVPDQETPKAAIEPTVEVKVEETTNTELATSPPNNTQNIDNQFIVTNKTPEKEIPPAVPPSQPADERQALLPTEKPQPKLEKPVKESMPVLPQQQKKGYASWWILLFVLLLLGGFWYWLTLPVAPLPDLLNENKETTATTTNIATVSASAMETVIQFVSNLGEQQTEKAYLLQKNPKWKDKAAFLSEDKGFGGITETAIYSKAEIDNDGKRAIIKMKYLSVDPKNDLKPIKKYNRNCEKPGVVYEQNFSLEKIADKWYIMSTELSSVSCLENSK